MEELYVFGPTKTHSKNWSINEKEALTRAIRERYDVLFGKFGSTLSNGQKSAAWKEVVDAVNACSNETRSLTQCQDKYKGLKKIVKTSAASNKREICKTGGGSADLIPFDSCAEDILATIPAAAYEGVAGGIDSSKFQNPQEVASPSPCLDLVRWNTPAQNVSEKENVESTFKSKEKTDEEKADDVKTPKRSKFQSPTEILLEKQVLLFEDQLKYMKDIKVQLATYNSLEMEKISLKRQKLEVLRELVQLKKLKMNSSTVPTFSDTSVSGGHKGSSFGNFDFDLGKFNM